ncbi:MAG: uncharacterized protein QOC85_702, partial [Streptomyces sp.]|nr:uncharacterized protein [Streptomyces sp.]
SPLPFVRDLGLSLGLGVVLTVAAALLLPRPGLDAVPAPDTVVVAASTLGLRPLLRRGAALLIALSVACAGWAGLSRLDVQADPQELASGLPALQDAQTVEQVLGSSGEIGIVLRGPDVLAPAALAWARQAQDTVIRGFGDQVRPVLGAPDLFAFLGPDPTPDQVTSALSLVPPYVSSAVVRPDRKAGVQVFGLRLQDLGSQADVLDRVQATLPPPPAGYSADVVGLPVAAGHGYRALLQDRYLVNLAGIVLAGIVLAVGLLRRFDALRAVVAAALAAGWGFALLWVLDLALSPLTVGLGALVAVTGCEFVVLLAQGRRLRHAWLQRSVAFACLTSAAGYLALAISDLRLVREFGLVLGAAVVLSYAAARLVVWAAPPDGRETAAQSGSCGSRDSTPDPVKGDV